MPKTTTNRHYFALVAANHSRERRLPRPDVHANLPAAIDGQTRVQSPLFAATVLIEILPVDEITLDGTEGDAVVPRLVTVDEVAPTLVARRVQQREVSAATREVVGGHVTKEGRDSIAAQPGCCVVRIYKPVGVEVVALAGGVLD